MATTPAEPKRAAPLQEFRPDQLPAAQKESLWLELPLGLAAPLRLPALVVRGHRPGPLLVAVAAVHGDEFEGVAAIQFLFSELRSEELSGTFLGLPICNPLAFEAQTRETPGLVDGLNLARVFPGDPAGSPTERLARALIDLLLRSMGPDDLLVDFHSAGTRNRFLPLIAYRAIEGPARIPSEEAARHFGYGRLWEAPDERGMLNAETTRAGIPTVGTETTGQGGCLPEDVAQFRSGLSNLLRYRRMLDGEPAPRTAALAHRARLIVADATGLFHAHVGLGAKVSRGDLLAEVVSPFGQRIQQVRAPLSAEIWALRTFATVRSGDPVFWLAPPVQG